MGFGKLKQRNRKMATSKFIKLKTEPFRVEFSGDYVIEDPGLYEFFKQYSASDYDKYFQRALRLGAYALEEERIAAFLGRAENELDAGLERLKVIYKMVNLKEKSAAKGEVAEVELADELQKYIDDMGWKDEVAAMGNKVGIIPRRKVGDLVIRINGGDLSVVIESKMDASVPDGDPTSSDERSKTSGNPDKSAYGQNITALVNRASRVAIAVFDEDTASASISDLRPITFQPELPGFIVKINRARGDFANLCLAYSIAREMALLGVDKIHGEHLNLILKRMVRDLEVLANTEADLLSIEESASAILESVKSIRAGIADTKASLDRTKELLNAILAGKSLSLDELRSYYNER
jgi:hypothetical protein